jgi:hypothetical protein
MLLRRNRSTLNRRNKIICDRVHDFVCKKKQVASLVYIGESKHAVLLSECKMFVHTDLHNSGYELTEILWLLILHSCVLTLASDIGFRI